MRRGPACAGFLALSQALVVTVYADGTLPPQPYDYLQPPQALAGTNHRPSPGERVLSPAEVRSGSWFVFTSDGQAGLSAPGGAIAPPPSTTSVRVRIDPVETPPGVPSHVTPEGNAYRITALSQPDGKPLTLARPVKVTLRWPYAPSALYHYASGSWSMLCDSSHATSTSSTTSCPTSSLGTFLAVTTPAGHISIYVWVLEILGILALAALGSYILSRAFRVPSASGSGSQEEG